MTIRQLSIFDQLALSSIIGSVSHPAETGLLIPSDNAFLSGKGVPVPKLPAPRLTRQVELLPSCP